MFSRAQDCMSPYFDPRIKFSFASVSNSVLFYSPEQHWAEGPLLVIHSGGLVAEGVALRKCSMKPLTPFMTSFIPSRSEIFVGFFFLHK